MQRHQPANLQLVGSDSLFGDISRASWITPWVDPQPIRVTSAFAGPCNLGGGIVASIPCTLRMRFSIMARRLLGLVYSSLISMPSSSCSSLEATWM